MSLLDVLADIFKSQSASDFRDKSNNTLANVTGRPTQNNDILSQLRTNKSQSSLSQSQQKSPVRSNRVSSDSDESDSQVKANKRNLMVSSNLGEDDETKKTSEEDEGPKEADFDSFINDASAAAPGFMATANSVINNQFGDNRLNKLNTITDLYNLGKDIQYNELSAQNPFDTTKFDNLDKITNGLVNGWRKGRAYNPPVGSWNQVTGQQNTAADSLRRMENVGYIEEPSDYNFMQTLNNPRYKSYLSDTTPFEESLTEVNNLFEKARYPKEQTSEDIADKEVSMFEATQNAENKIPEEAKQTLDTKRAEAEAQRIANEEAAAAAEEARVAEEAAKAERKAAEDAAKVPYLDTVEDGQVKRNYYSELTNDQLSQYGITHKLEVYGDVPVDYYETDDGRVLPNIDTVAEYIETGKLRTDDLRNNTEEEGLLSQADSGRKVENTGTEADYIDYWDNPENIPGYGQWDATLKYLANNGLADKYTTLYDWQTLATPEEWYAYINDPNFAHLYQGYTDDAGNSIVGNEDAFRAWYNNNAANKYYDVVNAFLGDPESRDAQLFYSAFGGDTSVLNQLAKELSYLGSFDPVLQLGSTSEDFYSYPEIMALAANNINAGKGDELFDPNGAYGNTFENLTNNQIIGENGGLTNEEIIEKMLRQNIALAYMNDLDQNLLDVNEFERMMGYDEGTYKMRPDGVDAYVPTDKITYNPYYTMDSSTYQLIPSKDDEGNYIADYVSYDPIAFATDGSILSKEAVDNLIYNRTHLGRY